jgi:hypothetical protein
MRYGGARPPDSSNNDQNDLIPGVEPGVENSRQESTSVLRTRNIGQHSASAGRLFCADRDF